MKVKILKQHTYGDTTYYPAGTQFGYGFDPAPQFVEVGDECAASLVEGGFAEPFDGASTEAETASTTRRRGQQTTEASE